MVRITIIGMGPIGTSIGLALKRSDLVNTEIVGTSRNRDALSRASKIGAVDKATGNLGSAVKGAQLVVLDTPMSETKELMEAIGPILDDGCVVTDTGISKVLVMEWADQYFPRGISFVGGHPLPKKQLRSLDDADSSVFKGIDYCIIPAKSAAKQSVETVVSVVEMLGAKPFFLDPQEHDSYAAAMSHMPIVLSSAFVTATAGSNGWREMHRLAASEFGGLSYLASNLPDDNEAACLANTEALVHWLDRIITELYAYRNNIKENSDSLLDSFVEAWGARSQWEDGTVLRDQEPKIPSAGEAMANAFVGGRLAERFRQMTGREKEKKKSGWRRFRKN